MVIAVAGGTWALTALVLLAVVVGLARQEMALRRSARLARRSARREESVQASLRELRAMTATNGRLLNQVADRTARLSQSAGVDASLAKSRPLDVRLRREYEQVQATINLFQRVETHGLVPAMRGWAASPDVLNVLVDELLTRRPRVVVECGSGVSTLWLALAVRQYGLTTRIISLDHEPEFLAATAGVLERHDVRDLVDLRLAPLVPTSLAGHATAWYDEAALEDLADVGLVFVDGPPESTGPLSRWPAVPVLHARLAADAVVLLDDAARPDEREAVARWTAEFPDLSATVLHLEKGAVLLRRSAAAES